MDTLARTRPGAGGSGDPTAVARQSLKRLAARHQAMQAEIDLIDDQLQELVRATNPALLSLHGAGPVTAATLLVAASDNAALHRIVLLRIRHREPRTMAYFARRRREGLTDRDIMRCLKRHIANEVYAALLNPATDTPAGAQLRARRQRAGIPISRLADTIGVPYQRLRRLEIGTRADTELERLANQTLDRLNPPNAA